MTAAERAALTALVTQWRAEATQDAHYPHVPDTLRWCADQLDAVLEQADLAESDLLAACKVARDNAGPVTWGVLDAAIAKAEGR